MPIRSFLDQVSFDPETVEHLGRALDGAVARFPGHLLPGTRRAMAILIIGAAKHGERDLNRLIVAGLGAGPKIDAK